LENADRLEFSEFIIWGRRRRRGKGKVKGDTENGVGSDDGGRKWRHPQIATDCTTSWLVHCHLGNDLK
jgi:hypothetical protein